MGRGTKRKRDHNDNSNNPIENSEGGDEESSSSNSAKKRKKGTRVSGSFVHKEFTEMEDDKSRVVCKHCQDDLMKQASNMKSHLKAKHPEVYEDIEHMDDEKTKQQNDRKKDKEQKKNNKIDLQQETIKMLHACGLPVTLVRSVDFRDWCEFVKKDFPHLSLETVWNLGEDMINKVKEQMKEDLAEASTVSIAVDAWTSGGMKHSFLGVFGCWYSKREGKVVHRVLALKHIVGSHTGKRLAELLVEICEDYCITEKVGFLSSDNASNMKTCVSELNEELKMLLGGIPPADEEYDPDHIFIPSSLADFRLDKTNEYDELASIKIALETPLDIDIDELAKHFSDLRSKQVKRIPCFEHTGQLVIKKSCSNGSYFVNLITKTRKVSEKFSRSEYPKQELREKGVELTILRTVSTRWWTDLLNMERQKKICDSRSENMGIINQILRKYRKKRKRMTDDGGEIEEQEEELKLDEEDLDKMGEYLEIFSPFMKKSELLSSEERVVTHLVIPCVKANL